MQSKRLSYALREKIWTNLKNEILQPKYDTLFDELCSIGTELYTAIIGEVHLDLIRKLPEHYTVRSTKVRINAMDVTWYEIIFSKSMPIPSAYIYGAIDYAEFWDKNEADRLLKLYKNKQAELRGWNNHIKECHDHAMMIMNGVNTTKQLVVIWPECAKYLPDMNKKVDISQLPMVQVSKLNTMLGLKKENSL